MGGWLTQVAQKSEVFLALLQQICLWRPADERRSTQSMQRRCRRPEPAFLLAGSNFNTCPLITLTISDGSLTLCKYGGVESAGDCGWACTSGVLMGTDFVVKSTEDVDIMCRDKSKAHLLSTYPFLFGVFESAPGSLFCGGGCFKASSKVVKTAFKKEKKKSIVRQ